MPDPYRFVTCPEGSPCSSCRELDAVLWGYFDAHPRAREVYLRDPQTAYYFDVLAQIAHDHVVRLDVDALTARIDEGFERRRRAEAEAHRLSAEPLPLATIAELRAYRGEAL